MRRTYCDSDDVYFDSYFFDETQFNTNSTICEPAKLDPQHQKVVLPTCLRGIQLDHYALNSKINYLPQMSIRVAPNNSIESIDLLYMILMTDGLSVNAFSIQGLHMLRLMKFRRMNFKMFFMVTINDANNFEDFALSDNRFELMTAKQFSKMFTKPLTIQKLNLSYSNIGKLDSDFFHHFPQLTYLDLLHNKLFASVSESVMVNIRQQHYY